MNESGYIYFASNASMSGLLKIGVTTTSPSERLPELQSTGVPTPFVLEACIRVVDKKKAEKRIHAILVKWRQTSNREFFQILLGDALMQCIPNISEFLPVTSIEHETCRQRITEDEEQVLLFLARQAPKTRRPKREEIYSSFKFSRVKSEYVLGSLLKRKFVCEVTEERKSNYDMGYYWNKVKVVNLEHSGIQYLLDNGLLTQTEL